MSNKQIVISNMAFVQNFGILLFAFYFLLQPEVV
jgi:hypothetical protein